MSRYEIASQWTSVAPRAPSGAMPPYCAAATAAASPSHTSRVTTAAATAGGSRRRTRTSAVHVSASRNRANVVDDDVRRAPHHGESLAAPPGEADVLGHRTGGAETVVDLDVAHVVLAQQRGHAAARHLIAPAVHGLDVGLASAEHRAVAPEPAVVPHHRGATSDGEQRVVGN